MPFKVDFQYENGSEVTAFKSEQLNDDKINAFLDLKVNDIIPLGNGWEKENYQILKIKRRYISASLTRESEETIKTIFVVRVVAD